VLLKERPRTPFSCSGYIANNDAAQIAGIMHGDEIQLARKLTTDLIQWLQAFNRALPKE